MGVDVTDVGARMLGLDEFCALLSGEYGGELEVVVETTVTVTGCQSCGVVATAHGRRDHLVRDIPVAGRAVLLVWRKRIWRCDEAGCLARTWTETSVHVAARAALTERARVWCCEQVGRDGRTVASVAAELGVGWATVMRAVRVHGQPFVDDHDRLEGVSRLGVDEHVWQHARKSRRTQFATGIVDLTPGRAARLLDVVPGRTGKVFADWINERDQDWRDGIMVAALDPFRGYATALRTGLPAATRVLDAFHVTKLGNTGLDDTRRRVQQDTLGHRGRKGDPLYPVRRLLLRGVEHLTPEQRTKIITALKAGDPDGEVTIAWWCAQQVRAIYHADTPQQGRQRAEALLASLHTCPVPEIARLGRTLRAWRGELLAYYDTDGASNGPTEAMNLIIEKTRRIGHGYRNFANYRLRLLLHCGVDWQTPATPRMRPRRPRLVA